MSKIYTPEGWVNWDYLYHQTKAFCMVVGARGTGKTYGLLKYIIQNRLTFLYVRRLKTQLDECGSMEGNPFKSVNNDLIVDIQARRRKNGVTFIRAGVLDDVCGYGVALSTFATLRGVDYSNIDVIVYDEAVPMANEKPIKDQFSSFLNMYETVNRNRQLQGRQPVRCFLLGNANKLNNPYFSGWGFMGIALKMLRGKQMMWRSPDNSRIMLLLQNSPISERKKDTVLYKNSSKMFDSMALGNSFAVDPTNIGSRPIKQYSHVCSCGQIGIYKHKSRSEMYISQITSTNNYFKPYGMQLELWRKQYQLLKYLYFSRMIVFQNYDVQLIFRQLTFG